MVEFMQYEPHLIGRGVEIDLDGESNVPGLFAIGDLVGNFRADIAGAAIFGWISGIAAAKRAKKIKSFHNAYLSLYLTQSLENPFRRRRVFRDSPADCVANGHEGGTRTRRCRYFSNTQGLETMR